eukprot:NODE_902_length_3185_cov_0.754051.p1 type:complete len:709 gc:universal NODE_902_length_3185_cov_0.754051:624-2750(+)
MNLNVKSILILHFTTFTHIFGISTDCPIILDFLRGLNLHLTDPMIFQGIPGWNSEVPADCCNLALHTAYGNLDISCTGTGSSQHVAYLQLGNVNINGTIQSQYILPYLLQLAIYSTPLSAPIPSDLPNTLKYLYLQNNKISGAVPETLPSQLTELQVNGNQLSVLPTSFPVGVTLLALYDNKFTKMPVLPPNLITLYIYNNFISDRLPNSYPNTLQWIGAQNNMIYGTIPNNIANTVYYLYLGNNQLQGAIPDILPTQLRYFQVSNNQLTNWPASFPSALLYLYVDGNKFITWPNLPPNLYALFIFQNLIYDKLPNSLPSTLSYIDASHNLLYGSIPVLPPAINYLDLGYNNLVGGFPIVPNTLAFLGLNFNLFTGNLPNPWPTGLGGLNINHNYFNGSITNITKSGWDLSWNLLSGGLPSINVSQGKFPKPVTVELSHNQLSGDIDLGYSTINDLRLSFNKFDKFPKSLPKSINTLKLDNNGMPGNISYDLPTTLITIDLSNNNLTGNIPNGSNFYFNDNYLGGNLSFLAPSQLYLQNNRLNDVLISNATGLSNCSLANNPMAPGVFGKTFQNQCNLNGIYTTSESTCRILTTEEILHPILAPTTALTTAASTIGVMASLTAELSASTQSQIQYSHTDSSSIITEVTRTSRFHLEITPQMNSQTVEELDNQSNAIESTVNRIINSFRSNYKIHFSNEYFCKLNNSEF